MDIGTAKQDVAVESVQGVVGNGVELDTGVGKQLETCKCAIGV